MVSMGIPAMAYAMDACLLGNWTAEEEVIEPGNPMMQLEIISGKVHIELLKEGVVRLTYDDYVVHRTMSMGQVKNTMELTYKGSVEGQIGGQKGKPVLSIYKVKKVDATGRRKTNDAPWSAAGEAPVKPPHWQDRYEFECSEKKLLLSKPKHGEFAGDYKGRFVRVD